ncbi:MAG: SMP-30/gluconolactonase/LRE family protein, partial [Caldilineaceae bacterium]
MELKVIADYQCHTGEGPLWHADEKRLYWVDIPQGRLFRYDPATGHHEQVYEGEQIGAFTIQTDGALLLFMAQGAVRIWRNGELTTILDSIPGEEESRFNDVIADPGGRVFCGTMPTPNRLGNLYRLDTDGSVHHLLGEIGTSNGLGFTPDRKQLYYTVTRERRIYRFDYDEATGAITNQQVFVDTK